MINFENSDISNIVIHHVGNKFEGGGLTLSDGCFLPEDPDVVKFIEKLFLVRLQEGCLLQLFAL